MRDIKRYIPHLLGVIGIVIGAGACTNVGEYSTAPGECYVGKIVNSDFVRSDTLNPDIELIMTLDADALGRGEEGATFTTSDGIFHNTPVRQMTELAHDSLSLLQFPGGRVRNYLAHASPTTGSPATIVISLMENNEIEVRVLRPDLDPDDGEDTALFGVFGLVRKDECSANP